MAQDTNTIECNCGTRNDADAKFCRECGRAFGQEWGRDQDTFALNVPPELIGKDPSNSVIIPFGSQGLIFENGQLVERVESGKYSFKKDNFLARLFGSPRTHSVFIMDAGDLVMDFKYAGLYTRDTVPVDLDVEIQFRCENASQFFTHLMKDKETFAVDDFRPVFWGQIKNALESALKGYDFDQLSTDLALKKELASKLDAHIRVSFSRAGLELIQVKAVSFSQQDQERIRQREADRKVRQQETDQDRKDITARADEIDVETEQAETVGEKEVNRDLVKAELLTKRVSVLQSLQKAEIEEIKTKEDFRKFRQEIDRDQVLDQAEWDEFEREILWKEEDAKRDRSFLTDKVSLQQAHDLKRLALLNNADLALEDKRQQFRALDLELTEELSLELKKINGLAEARAAEASARAQEERLQVLTRKQTQVEAALQDLELKKEESRFKRESKLEDGRTQFEVDKLELEMARLEKELADANKEKMMAMERKHKAEEAALELKMQNERLDMRLREKAADAKIETDRIQTLAGLSLEQLIAVSGQDQAAILGDLAQSQTLKGLSPDEIMAMKDPQAFKDALVERAKHADTSEIKDFYERIITLTQDSSDKVAQAHKESADRAERMAARQQEAMTQGFAAMGGQNQNLADLKARNSAARERIYDKSMDRVADVAAGRPGPGRAGMAAGPVETLICRNCRQQIAADSNVCSNCGEKVY